MEYEIEWDENTEMWCVFRGKKCISMWISKELAEESAQRLRANQAYWISLGLKFT